MTNLYSLEWPGRRRCSWPSIGSRSRRSRNGSPLGPDRERGLLRLGPAARAAPAHSLRLFVLAFFLPGVDLPRDEDAAVLDLRRDRGTFLIMTVLLAMELIDRSSSATSCSWPRTSSQSHPNDAGKRIGTSPRSNMIANTAAATSTISSPCPTDAWPCCSAMPPDTGWPPVW